MCVKCDALFAEIRRCRAGEPHKDRKDYYRQYYKQNRDKKLAAAKDRRNRIILEELRLDDRYNKRTTIHAEKFPSLSATELLAKTAEVV